ncbi:hypothetical protein A7981_04680 [Methylovorus sp. MM2]|nr:hypothetical protein A7981_04680 [Methylovorus sp. MM2]
MHDVEYVDTSAFRAESRLLPKGEWIITWVIKFLSNEIQSHFLDAKKVTFYGRRLNIKPLKTDF